MLRLQASLTGLAVVIALLVSGGSPATAVSALLGGLVVLVPALVYARIAYAKRHVPPAELIKAHFLAEAVKFCLTVLLSGAVLASFKDLSVAGFLGGFFAAISGYGFGLLIKN
ncbi:ATP synthase subunit I [Chromobacterium sp. IIBBL 290-4]|uniref:ATP synthase subunit I n=1 Tax=Chromobacterium sp. IIBBL 290-4 TaxID=2953890 RepID=UPI0020B81787|nr:ATP synthase subunit I [Chromobacterium sp. IIBBL 290-4]UTH76375.1 ATP synthase subunit I [Chromobacterium sp. IIBBL 290-4]